MIINIAIVSRIDINRLVKYNIYVILIMVLFSYEVVMSEVNRKNRKSTNYEDFKAQLLQDAEVRQEYEALKPQFNLLRQIIARRNELKLSQMQLAKRVGTEQSAISRLESGCANVSVKTWYKVAKALDADLEISLKVR